MKRIKSFNESSQEIKKIWVVLLFDVGGYIGESCIKLSFAFESEMKARDKFIKLVNEHYDQDFEAYFEDGERLFVDVNENTDFEEAIEFVNDRDKSSEPNIEILDIEIEA